MHERTQQVIARTLFVLCCAVPLFVIIVWITLSNTSWYQSRVAASLRAEIQKELGLLVQFDHHRHPAPDRWIFSNLRLSHPETSARIGRIREAHWVKEDGRSRMLLQQPEIEAKQLSMLWQSVHEHLLCRPYKIKNPVAISANDLTIQSGNHAFTLSEIDASISNSSDISSLTLLLQVADGLTHSPISMDVQRDRTAKDIGSKPPVTTISVDTNGTPIPCSALIDFCPTLESLGRSATFSGQVQWKTQGGSWSVDLGNSRFEQIALDKLFESQAHRLSGTATIQLERCLVAPSKNKSDITGIFFAEKGLIGKTLLQSAGDNLPLHLLETQLWNQFSGDLPYDVISIGFNVNGTQLQLEGLCHQRRGYENYPTGVAIVLNGYPLAQSSNRPVESVRLLTAIAPTHSVPVLLSQQTNWLTKVLIPPSRPLPVNQTAPPRIRSAGVWQGGPTIDQPQ